MRTITILAIAFLAFGAFGQMNVHRREFAIQTLNQTPASPSTTIWTSAAGTIYTNPDGGDATVGGWTLTGTSTYPNGSTGTANGWVSSASTVYPQ